MRVTGTFSTGRLTFHSSGKGKRVPISLCLAGNDSLLTVAGRIVGEYCALLRLEKNSAGLPDQIAKLARVFGKRFDVRYLCQGRPAR